MAASLLVQTGQHVPVRVFNPGKDPMLLYKGTVAGQIIPISEESIQIDIQKKEHLRAMTEDQSDQDRPIPTHLQQLELELHSDQGSNFQSKVMAEVCRLLGIQKTRTTPYNPKSDGLVERFNLTLLDTMAKLP